MHRIDSAGATVGGLFTEGNPSTGTPATVVSADWANAVQEEIIAVLTAAGIAPVKAVNTQLTQAINALIAAAIGGGGGVAASSVSIADAGGYFAGANVEVALQEVGAALAGNVAASKVLHGIVALFGAAQQTETAHAGAILEITHGSAITYTVRADATLNLPIGTSIHLAQAGAGQITVAAAGGVTVKKSATFNAKTLDQESIIVLTKVAANTWRLGGMLEPV